MRTRVLVLLVAFVASATVSVEATAQALQEITVTAKRLNLAPIVRNFVNQIALLANGEGLARWDTPMCPTVIGLPQQEDEFILGRISEIARAAGVRVAGESCGPNLFVVVTADPKGLLEQWNDHNDTRLGIFNGATWRYDPNGAPQSVVEPFINTPRAARVWYFTGASDTWGQLAVVAGPKDNSHIQLNIVYGFFRVFVIVDQARLNGLTIGQFADYVSMVGLTQIKPDAHLGDTPTILKLFDADPQAASAGLTDWDQAFLKSVYATDQQSKTQRAVMARQMVRDITP
ncbi:MAG: hypothetical protein WA825_14555 [Steroidobacteraceae bacterium]